MPTPIDCVHLYSRLAADPDLGDIIEMFVDEMPERMQRLWECLETGDMAGLERAAHQIKGSAGGYGFDEITPQAARLELAVKERRTPDDIRLVAQELAELCNRVRKGTA